MRLTERRRERSMFFAVKCDEWMLSISFEWVAMPMWAHSIQFTFPSSPTVPMTVAGVG